MKKYTLGNGLVILHEKRPTKSVAIEITVKVGSNNEPKKINGISHFIEHMLFEGTKKRKTSKAISSEIEKLGGELNAYTSNERTAFFAKVLSKHFNKALDILSDIIQNPLFETKNIEKERKVILKEIDMVRDEPRFHQWVLFQKTLFQKHPTKNPTYGTIKAVKSVTRNDILSYYNSYYKPNNMIISVAGNVDNVKQKVQKHFKNFSKKPIKKTKQVIEPKQKNIKKSKEKRKLFSSYVVFGYKTPIRKNKDSYTLDIIDSILGRGQSGRLFEEIRNKYGLAYEVGTQHEAAVDYGFFAVYLNTDKKNIPKVIKIILDEFKKLKKITKSELKEAKIQIEGSIALENDDNFRMADHMAFWEIVKDAELSNQYIKKIKKVTIQDIKRVIDKYLNKNYTLAVIEQD